MKRCTSNSHGASMIEASLVFPLLLLILFGIIQYGFLLAAQITLRSAAGAAVREFAVIGSTTCNTLRTVAGQGVAPLLDPDDMDLDPDEWDPGDGRLMRRVTLLYDFGLILPFFVPNSSGGRVQLRADSAMRCEQSCGTPAPALCAGP